MRLPCPGHSDVIGNEEADRLAVIGSEQGLSDDSMDLVDRTISADKTRLRLWAHQRCIDYWTDRPLLRHSKNFIKPFSEWNANYLLSLSRRQLRFVTGFLAGHGTFKGHLKKMQLVTDDACRLCDQNDAVEEETAEHLLCECKSLARLRQRVFGSGFLSPVDFLSINDDMVLRFISNANIQKLFNVNV